MLFYRVETEDGRGPYKGGAPWDWYYTINFEHDMIARHPMAYDDAGLKKWYESNNKGRGYHYAFKSLDQFKSWFYTMKSREFLEEHGLSISVYECEDGVYGDTQALFRKEKATLLYKLKLTEV